LAVSLKEHLTQNECHKKTSKLMENINPTANSKMYGLDHLRALAILLVLFFHYQLWFPHPTWTSWFMQLGWTGVDLFFVLSGFLISSQLFSQIKKGRVVWVMNFHSIIYFAFQ